MIHLLLLLLVFFFLSTITVEGEGKAPRKEKLVQLVGIWDEQLTEGFSPGRPPPSANPPRSLTSRLIYNELLFFNPGPTVTLLALPPHPLCSKLLFGNLSLNLPPRLEVAASTRKKSRDDDSAKDFASVLEKPLFLNPWDEMTLRWIEHDTRRRRTPSHR